MFNRKKMIEKEQINHHFTFIEAPIDMVAPEIMLWADAEWWPKGCAMHFTRRTELPVREGMEYQVKVNIPFGPKGIARVTQMVPGKMIERKLVTDMFDGFERVKVEERANGSRIDYEMHYKVKGLPNKIFWKFFAIKQHDKNIEMILAALKEHILNKFKHFEQSRWENP